MESSAHLELSHLRIMVLAVYFSSIPLLLLRTMFVSVVFGNFVCVEIVCTHRCAYTPCFANKNYLTDSLIISRHRPTTLFKIS